MTTHIDLYAIHRLDRSAPPQALAAALTAQLNSTDPQDALTRGRIETARAILGDPAKRSAYDARLAEPRPVTEQTLARLAGGTAPTAAPGSSSGLVTSLGKPKVLASLAAALALLLIVVVTAVSCSGGDTGSKSASTNSGGASELDALPECWKMTSDDAAEDLEKWTQSAKKPPTTALVLDQVIDLPTEFAALDDGRPTGTSVIGLPFGLTQFQDRNIGVTANSTARGQRSQEITVNVAVVGQDGQVVSVRKYTAADRDTVPKPFDLANSSSGGYFRIQGTGGVDIPASATGTEKDMVFATDVLPDAFDHGRVWVLLRDGSSRLYKGHLYFERVSGSLSDPSKCATESPK